jgi:hypothetical protein
VTGARTAALLLLLTASRGAQADMLFKRDLQCDAEQSPRARTICKALEKGLRWLGTGREMPIIPSLQVGFDTAVDVYCRLPVQPSDTKALVEMRLSHESAPPAANDRMRQLQLEHGANFLLYLLGASALERLPNLADIRKPAGRADDADLQRIKSDIEGQIQNPSSIFNPKAPGYLLREGCKTR